MVTFDQKTTVALNDIVTGDRTNNERIFDLDYAADIDLKSCYGTALQDILLPIGLPTIISRAPNEKYRNIKSFLKKYEHELIPNLWKIVVSGTLSFDQDLIISRLIGTKALENFHRSNNDFYGDFDELTTLNTRMVVLRREIINGVITNDILEVLKCSAVLLKSIMSFYN